MSPGCDEEPEYAWLRALVATRGEELRHRYGAHAVGIGRKKLEDGEPGPLALRLYVDPHGPGWGKPEPIPPTIAFTPPGADHQVELPTDVVPSAPAQFE